MVIDPRQSWELSYSSFFPKCPSWTACTSTLSRPTCKCLISLWEKACLIQYCLNDWRTSWRHCSWMCTITLVQVGSICSGGAFLCSFLNFSIVFTIAFHWRLGTANMAPTYSQGGKRWDSLLHFSFARCAIHCIWDICVKNHNNQLPFRIPKIPKTKGGGTCIYWYSPL
jgi:hypothetical protein